MYDVLTAVCMETKVLDINSSSYHSSIFFRKHELERGFEAGLLAMIAAYDNYDTAPLHIAG